VDRPLAAAILIIIGGVFYIIGGFVAAVITGWLGELAAGIGVSGVSREVEETVVTVISTGFISGGGIIVGALLVWTGSRRKVLAGGATALIFSLIGIVNTIGGIVVGFVLTLVGSILAFTWKKQNTHSLSRAKNNDLEAMELRKRTPDRCPKCGGYNVVGYMGVYECIDCGQKFT